MDFFLCILLLLGIALYIQRSLLPALRAKKSLDGIISERQVQMTKNEAHPRIHVMFPLHDEQDVAKTIHHNVTALASAAPTNVAFYLLTSERERLERPNGVTTYESLFGYKWPSNVHLVNLPFFAGGKGALLNRALEQLDVQPHEWVGIYDADSMPEPTVFSHVNHCAESAGIVQQPSKYLLNYDSLDALLKPQAVFQTIWSLGTELPRYAKYTSSLKSAACPWKMPYIYFVGHGLFLRKRIISELGGFPDIYEDLRIGIPVVLMREQVHIVPSFDRCGFADSVQSWIRQSWNWTNGSWFVVRDCRELCADELLFRRLAVICLTGKAVVSNLCWSVEGILVPTVIIAAILTGSPVALAVGSISSLIYLVVEPLMLRWSAKQLARLNCCGITANMSLLSCLLRLPLRSIGPLLATFAFIFRCGPDSQMATRSTVKKTMRVPQTA